MALTYISSMVKEKGYGKQWQNVNITSKTFVELFNTYAQVILRIHDSITGSTKDLWISKNRGIINNINYTVTQWLVSMANVGLPYEPNQLWVQTRPIFYCNGNIANFRTRHVSHLYSPDTDVPLSERRNLLVTRSNADYGKIHANCLFTVNGMFHRSTLTSDGIVIYEGGSTQQQSNDIHFGILDFEKAGEIVQIPLTESNIYTDDVGYYQSTYIKSSVPLEGKSVVLCLGGYLFTGLNNSIKYIGNDIVHVDMYRLGLLERIFESMERIDMPFLKDYLIGDNTVAQLRVSDVKSEDFVKSWLTLSQSFLVVIDTEDLVAKTQLLENDKTIFQHLTQTKPTSLLQTGYGRCEDYWFQKDGGRYVLYANNIKKNFTFRNHEWEKGEIVSNLLETQKPNFQEDVQFLHLFAEELISSIL